MGAREMLLAVASSRCQRVRLAPHLTILYTIVNELLVHITKTIMTKVAGTQREKPCERLPRGSRERKNPQCLWATAASASVVLCFY